MSDLRHQQNEVHDFCHHFSLILAAAQLLLNLLLLRLPAIECKVYRRRANQERVPCQLYQLLHSSVHTYLFLPVLFFGSLLRPGQEQKGRKRNKSGNYDIDFANNLFFQLICALPELRQLQSVDL